MTSRYTVVPVMGSTWAIRDNLTYEYIWCGPKEEAMATAEQWNNPAVGET